MGVLTTQRNSGKQGGLLEFTQGVDVDCRLFEQEIDVQIAWAKGLVGVEVLSASESKKVVDALEAARASMSSGKFNWRVEDEDIHMNLERFVTEMLGDLGKRMHAGRSRNDLIATTFRLFVKSTLDLARQDLRTLVQVVARKSEHTMDILVPGTTHLQHGQPVRFGHILVGHGWAFQRDIERFQIAADRSMAAMPLGSAALAGTTLPIDLPKIAQELGFVHAPLNSYDAVGDRDFVLEALDAIANAGVHFSRISEDLIIWASTAVGLVRLPKDWSTGSSIMPNKRNPDVPELARAKSAHLMGAASEAKMLMKGVATSYGSDLHEIKQIYIRALDELRATLAVLTPFIEGIEVNTQQAAALLNKGHILATDVADHLVSEGVAFRDAYSQVAALVELAESRGLQISALSPADWSTIAPRAQASFLAALSAESAVEKRCQSGGTAKAAALESLAKLRATI